MDTQEANLRIMTSAYRTQEEAQEIADQMKIDEPESEFKVGTAEDGAPTITVSCEGEDIVFTGTTRPPKAGALEYEEWRDVIVSAFEQNIVDEEAQPVVD